MSWNGLGDMICDVAKTEYVSKMRELDPSWNPTSNETRSGMGVSVSVMKHDQEKISDDDKNIFDWCREGSLKKVAALLPDETPLDDENRTLLHWACDRGHIEIVRHLIELGHDVNCQDYDKSTPLHYASSCDHPDIIRLLLLNNADASLADEDGEMPIHCSASDSIRKIFGNFTKDKI
ncbi:unnamed protein product [Clavelina lepadiformis]|uniref:Acyl-CoA-binding domain-containing protein 6 n=1 Tax=Clavelina lepadiformis TaxID=159417 RepID=A0ABP0GIS3_CLALP